ncbi:hypothetical protein [Dickeya fangzhongdai]|uniref:hypothetical protein n=1 Tax=Dickeya fangzhongdai TaxID=1778540 RepID=UPI0023E45004|nr:hypothetical protein [Dickeya fangzhongdai]WES90734.1 hypothetical protein PQ617_09650 [Dickeya fangzhongdai]
MSVRIVRVGALPDVLATLIAESQRQGFRFLQRLREGFQSGANQFRLPGEGLGYLPVNYSHTSHSKTLAAGQKSQPAESE